MRVPSTHPRTEERSVGKKTNYHCHCDLCDGDSPVSDFVDEAAERGLGVLGFSSHAPLPFPTDWCIGRGRRLMDLFRYRETVARAAEAYSRIIEVRTGLEVDYIPGLIGPAEPLFRSLDYRIGSVHFLSRGDGGPPWAFDSDPESFNRGLRELWNGDASAFVRAYYAAVAEMVERSPPDIVAHLDLVKKYNGDGTLFHESESWYLDAVEAALESIARSRCLVEVNTGGMARFGLAEPYPSPWILHRCREYRIGLVLGSDCHSPGLVDHDFARTEGLIAEAGYAATMVLGREGWEERKLDLAAPARDA